MRDREEESRKRILESLIEINREIEEIHDDVVIRIREIEDIHEDVVIRTREIEELEEIEEAYFNRTQIDLETGMGLEYNDRFGNSRLFSRAPPVNSRNTSEVQRLQLNNTRDNEGITDRTVGNFTTLRQRPDIFRTPSVFEYEPPRVVSERNPPPIFTSLDIEPSLVPSEFTLWRNTRRDAVDYSEYLELNSIEASGPSNDTREAYFMADLRPERITEAELPNMEDVKVPTDIKTLIEKTKVKICEKYDDNCAICQEIYKSQDIVRHLIFCNHLFHIECIDKWFSENHTCPECRFDINDINLPV
jgi:hypothetical protein